MSTLIKPLLHGSVAETLLDEINTRAGRYYYFLGKVLTWQDESAPPLPVDSIEYENEVRRNIVIVKEIRPGDVSLIIDRVNWQSGTVYDMYDNRISDEVDGINLMAGGTGYSNSPNVTISGGGGFGAKANAYTNTGVITSIVLTDKGYGYNSAPIVTITDPYGSNANAIAVLSRATSGAANLQSSNFYVVNDELNIYKCLDNNNGGKSTYKPTQTGFDPFILPDGYVWKFMGTVLPSLRHKFATRTKIPVVRAINDSFYSGGEIKKINILDTGNNYTTASLTVTGDGYLADDPFYLSTFTVSAGGSGYSSANVTIEPPIFGTISWTPNTLVYIGLFLNYNNNFYEVVNTGTTASQPPVHTAGIETNGSCGLKFVGKQATAITTLSGGQVTSIVPLGSIRSITLIDSGSGYTSPPRITFTGGGGANANAYAVLSNGSVVSYVITDIGSDYTSAPTVQVGRPWVANANVALNEQIYNGQYLYTISDLDTDGTVREANVTFGGNGYIKAPNITFVGGGGNNLSAFAQLSNNVVANIFINDIGEHYTSAPTVVIGDEWAPNINVYANTQIFYLSNLYTVLETANINASAPLHVTGIQQFGNANLQYAGTVATATVSLYKSNYLNTTAPTHITGTVKLGGANVTFAGGRAEATAVLKYGAGYTYTPNLTITGDGSNATGQIAVTKSEALIRPVVDNGRIVRVIIDNGGTGYTYAVINVIGDGSNAKFYIDFSPGDLISLQSSIELLANEGGIHAAKVISGGYGYPGTIANVSITGDGTGATATATVLGGKVTKINIVTPGTGYTTANVNVVSDVGRGAYARAIFPPKGGHGKNLVQELFARAIAFYSNVSDDTNQGFDVDNDYRQFGIIRSITNYDDPRYFNESIGSACWVINGVLSPTIFSPDRILTSTYSGGRFLIVASTSTGVLVQALGSADPTVGELYSTDTGETFVATGVTKPAVDKYSGDLMYIDNRLAFTPSTEQAVSLLTVFTF